MELQKDESMIREFHHDFFCFIERTVKIVIVSLPIFYMASIFSGFFTLEVSIAIYLGIAAVFSFILANDIFVYHADRLIVTNKRIIHVDWKSLFKKTETEADLVDIQDIKITNGGILTLLPFFNFGSFTAETSSTKTSIIFEDAPEPEVIRDLIYHMTIKPSKIEGSISLSTFNDTARTRTKEEVSRT